MGFSNHELARNILCYNAANNAFIEAKRKARDMGLDKADLDQILPFPAPQIVLVNQKETSEKTTTTTTQDPLQQVATELVKEHDEAKSPANGLLQKLVLGGALLAGGTGAGYVINDLFNSPEQPQVQNHQDGSVGVEIH